MIDLLWLNALPEPHKTILLGAAGDYIGSMAAAATGRLIGALSSRARKRFDPAQELTPLNRAMAKALAVTVTGLTGDADLYRHYLTLLNDWMKRDVVVEELSLVIDPRPDVSLDLGLLRDEFTALDYDPDLLGSGVTFERIVRDFVRAFYNAAAQDKELQGQIEIGLLRRIVERLEEQVGLQRRTIAVLEAVLEAYQKPMGKGRLSEADVERVLAEYLVGVARMYDRARLFGSERPLPDGRLPDLTAVFVPVTLRAFKPPGRQELEEALRGKAGGLDVMLARHELTHAKGRGGDIVPLKRLLTTSDRIAIVGGAGSGKSTVLAYLAATLARAAQTGEPPPYDLPGAPIPVPLLVPLRYYRDYREECRGARGKRVDDPRVGTLAGFIPWYLRSCNPALRELSEDFFDRLLLAGGCILMIDGLDEVTSREERVHVRQEIDNLVYVVYPNNRVIVTAREAGYTHEEEVFGSDFKRFDVQDLAPDQIRALVHNWCAHLYPEDPQQRHCQVGGRHRLH